MVLFDFPESELILTLEEFRKEAQAAIEQFDLAAIFHGTWKPSATDTDLHARLGTSYATQSFRAVNTALRWQMFMALMRLWDTRGGVGLKRIAQALAEPQLIEALINEALPKVTPEGDAKNTFIRDQVVESIGACAKEIVGEIEAIHGTEIHGALRTLRNQRLAHFDTRASVAANADVEDDLIGPYLRQTAAVIAKLSSLALRTAYDPMDTEQVFAHYARFFWAGVSGERTKVHPLFRQIGDVKFLRMEHLYDQALSLMESTVHAFASQLPPPQLVQLGAATEFRYVEQHIQQAIVLKLARLVSALRAARLLMQNGFVQEQGALQRMIDDTQEDVVFLVMGAQENGFTDLHKGFLDAFWEEELSDPDNPLSGHDRSSTPRHKIRAATSKLSTPNVPASTMIDNRRAIQKTYSGYVHGASPHIMDMYGGNPPSFHMAGLLGTPIHESHRVDLWNCFHRAVCAFACAAKAFGDAALFEQVRRYVDQFAQASGMSDAITKPA